MASLFVCFVIVWAILFYFFVIAKHGWARLQQLPVDNTCLVVCHAPDITCIQGEGGVSTSSRRNGQEGKSKLMADSVKSYYTGDYQSPWLLMAPVLRE